MIVAQFGLTTGKMYRFPERSHAEFQDNFRQTVDGIKAVIGKSGGVDQFGTGPSLTRPGEVKVSFWLKDIGSALEMQTTLAAINAMTDYGIQPLIREMDDGTKQYCMARLSNAPEVHTYRNQPEKRLQISLTFTVPDPVWLKSNIYSTTWGGGATWGGGYYWGGLEYVTVAASGLESSKTVTNNGNAIIPVRLQVYCNLSQTCQFPTIQRIKDGAVIEQVQWMDTVAAGQRLYIDAKRHRVMIEGVSRYDALTVLTADWLTLEPGANSFKVYFENSTDAATVFWHYTEAYR